MMKTMTMMTKMQRRKWGKCVNAAAAVVADKSVCLCVLCVLWISAKAKPLHRSTAKRRNAVSAPAIEPEDVRTTCVCVVCGGA